MPSGQGRRADAGGSTAGNRRRPAEEIGCDAEQMVFPTRPGHELHPDRWAVDVGRRQADRRPPRHVGEVQAVEPLVAFGQIAVEGAVPRHASEGHHPTVEGGGDEHIDVGQRQIELGRRRPPDLLGRGERGSGQLRHTSQGRQRVRFEVVGVDETTGASGRGGDTVGDATTEERKPRGHQPLVVDRFTHRVDPVVVPLEDEGGTVGRPHDLGVERQTGPVVDRHRQTEGPLPTGRQAAPTTR